MTITSPAFEANDLIPSTYTCDGENAQPPLAIAGVPANANSLALIVDDPDAPNGTWVHWVVYNIPPSTTTLTAGTVSGTEIAGSSGKAGYAGPCPPSGTHRYFFKLYALDTMLTTKKTLAGKAALEELMQGHIIAQAELIGRYARK